MEKNVVSFKCPKKKPKVNIKHIILYPIKKNLS